MPLDVGSGLVGIAFREGAQLRWWHGERPFTQQEVLKTHGSEAKDRIDPLVQGHRIVDLVDSTHLQMVLQVLADTGELMQWFDACRR